MLSTATGVEAPTVTGIRKGSSSITGTISTGAPDGEDRVMTMRDASDWLLPMM